MAHQVIITHDDRSWDSIRDTSREALFKAAEYMLKADENLLVDTAKVIRTKLIFGADIESIQQVIARDGFTITIKYIP